MGIKASILQGFLRTQEKERRISLSGFIPPRLLIHSKQFKIQKQILSQGVYLRSKIKSILQHSFFKYATQAAASSLNRPCAAWEACCSCVKLLLNTTYKHIYDSLRSPHAKAKYEGAYSHSLTGLRHAHADSPSGQSAGLPFS